MIRIGKPFTTTRLALGGGAWLEYRPMSALDREAGRLAAQRVARAVSAGQSALSDYGLADFGMANLGEGGQEAAPAVDADLSLGAGAVIALTEIALRCVTAWEGVCGMDGEPLAIDRRSMSALLRDPFYFDMMDTVLSSSLTLVDIEGNGSAPSANGAQGADKPIAPAAASSDSPAPTAAPAPTDSSAPSA